MTPALSRRPARTAFAVLCLWLLALASLGRPCLLLGAMNVEPGAVKAADCCKHCPAPAAPKRAPDAPCCETIQAANPSSLEGLPGGALQFTPVLPVTDWQAEILLALVAASEVREAGPPPGEIIPSLAQMILRRCVPAHAPPALL